MTDTPYPLGRVQHHDPRSWNYRATVPTQLRSVRHRIPPLARRLDQGETGSCEGNGTVHCLGSQPLKRPRARYRKESDALAVYTLATALDDFDGQMPDQDTGTSNVAVAKAAQQFGWITSYQWHFGLQSALAGLTAKPLLAGVPWFGDMFTPDHNGFLNATGELVGGHAFCLYEINVEQQYVSMLNSWRDWGVGQTARLSFATLGHLLDQGGEITAFTV